MTATEHEAMRQRALTVLAHYAGPAVGAEAIGAAADRAYDDLVRVLAPVVGDHGVSALADRAVHNVQRRYTWLIQTREPQYTEQEFSQVIAAVKRQDPAVATEAAAAVFATFLALLATLIGKRLTDRLLRDAWPDAFGGAKLEET